MLLRPVLMPILRNPLQGIADGIRNMLAELLGSSQFFAPLTHSLVLARGTGSPTFTRASTATFTDWEGVLRTVPSGCARFEGARMVRNLLTFTEDFSNAAWQKSFAGAGSAPVVTADQEANPIAGTSIAFADKVVFAAPGAGDLSMLQQSFTGATGNVYLGSFYVKAFAAGDVGKVILFRHAAGDSYTQVTLTAAYQRVSLKETGIGAVTFDVGLRPTFSSSSGTVSIYLTAAQLNDITGETDQTTIRPYVSVGVESAPAYHGSMVDGVKCYDTDRSGNPISTSGSYPIVGYVPWEARTNLQTYSNDFTNAVWNNEGARTVITAAAGTSPSGANDAWSLIPTSDNNAHRVYNPAIVNPSGTFTISLWAKTIGGYNLTLTDTGGLWQADFDLTNGTVATPTTGESLAARIEACPNGWYRCSATVTSASGNFPLQWTTDVNKTLSYVGNTTSGVYWYGYQVELGSFATPYQPTTTVAVARNADWLTYSGIFSDTAGTFYCEAAFPYSVAGNEILTGTTGLLFQLNAGQLQTYDGTNSAQQAISVSSTKKKMSCGYGSGKSNFLSGVKSTGGSAAFDGSMNLANTIGVGCTVGGTLQLNGPVGNIRYWNRQLSDSEQTATTS